MTHAAIPDGEVDGAREAALDEMESDLHASYQAWRTKGYAEGSGNQFRRAAETIAQLRARLTALEAEKDALKAEVAGLIEKCANACFEIGNAYMAKSAHNLPASEKAQVAFECEKRIRSLSTSQGEQGR